MLVMVMVAMLMILRMNHGAGYTRQMLPRRAEPRCWTITRHHQDEELTMQNVRICRTVVSDRHHKTQTMLSKI